MLSRRTLLITLPTFTSLSTSFGALPTLAAKDPVLISWQDLMPPPAVMPDDLDFSNQDEPSVQPYDPDLGGIVQHGMSPAGPGFLESADVVTKYDDVQVKIAGYVLPLDFTATNVNEFLLVPYVGACIHVPPPPPNQIIYVISEEGIEVTDLFDPVWATGTLQTAALSSDLADVGYQMTLDESEPYQY